MEDTAIGVRLASDTLERRGTLPLTVQPVTLTGTRVQLRPLELSHDIEPLHAMSNGQPARLGDRSIGAYDSDELIWRHMWAGPFSHAYALEAYLRPRVKAPDGLCLCVVDRPTGQPVGVANFMNNAPEHLRIELGGIWYSPLAQGCGVNTEATYLMLRHAFDLGYRRVEWRCNARNERSWHAARKMGFKFESVMESWGIIKECNRDTAVFRMLDSEWPDTMVHLEHLIAAHR
jgi:RimJ/RimL family protein N-acetyltransferase